MGSQALGHLRDPIPALSLLHQCPTAQNSIEGYPEWEPLFLRKAQGGFGMLLGSTPLTAELMEHGSSTQGRRAAEGVRCLLCQRYRCLALPQPLLRIPQRPQRPRGTVEQNHPHVLPQQERKGVGLLGMIMRDTLYIVG